MALFSTSMTTTNKPIMTIKDKYRFGFEPWGLVLFLLIMLPNIIWFILPAPNDILRAESVTPIVDSVGMVCQVAMVAALCVVLNVNYKKRGMTILLGACLLSAAVYFVCWVLYYLGMVGAPVVLGLTLPPCLAFIFFALDRKNYIALIPAVLFTVCHLIYGVVNFII